MAKDNPFADEMKRFRTSKTYRGRTEENRSNEQVNRLKSVIRPVVDEFVDADDALAIQSARGGTIFISFGFTLICKLDITVHDMTAHVALTGDPDYSYDFMVSVDPLDEDKVQASVKRGLLGWYKRCFS